MTQEQDVRARVCSRRIVADCGPRIVISSRGGYRRACAPAEIGATVRSYALKTLVRLCVNGRSVGGC